MLAFKIEQLIKEHFNVEELTVVQNQGLKPPVTRKGKRSQSLITLSSSVDSDLEKVNVESWWDILPLLVE